MLAEVSARLPVQLRQPAVVRRIEPDADLFRAAVAERRRRGTGGGSHPESPARRSMGTVDVPVQRDGPYLDELDRRSSWPAAVGGGRLAQWQRLRALHSPDAAAGGGVLPELFFGADSGSRRRGRRARGVQPADADVGVSRRRGLSVAPRLATGRLQLATRMATLRPT